MLSIIQCVVGMKVSFFFFFPCRNSTMKTACLKLEVMCVHVVILLAGHRSILGVVSTQSIVLSSSL